MTAIRNKIDDLKINALKNHNKDEYNVYVSILANFKQWEVDHRGDDLTENIELSLIRKMVKQRKESITLFDRGGRQDLVDKELYELSIIESFIPKSLPDNEIINTIHEIMNIHNISSMKQMGQIMKILKDKFNGRADMKNVSNIVKSLLNAS